MGLPALPPDPTGSHGGKWHAILQLSKTSDVAGVAAQASRPTDAVQPDRTREPNLQFRAGIAQSGYAPGSQLMLTATLSEYGVPVAGRATVWAEMARPDGTSKVLPMKEEEPGTFHDNDHRSCGRPLSLPRARASGVTFRERPFTREQTLTAVIGSFGESSSGSELCKFLDCLMSGKVLQPGAVECLRAQGIDWNALAECVRKQCRGRVGKG